MGDILIKGVVIPNNCFECEWRDAEACGECEIMISNPFRSFEDQYSHCPFKEIGKRHPIITIPPHGDLIDRAEFWVEINKICDRRDAGIITDLTCLQQILSAVRHAPTIIEADRGDDQ